MIESIDGAGGAGGGVQSIVAGTGISVNNTDPENPIVSSTGVDTDEKAKVSSNDTTAGYLNGKLVAGSNVTLTENNNGGNETLTIAATVPVTSVNTKTGAVTLTNTDVGAAATSHTHAASDITSGVIATARLGTGTADATTYLAGDQTYKAAVTSVNGSTGAVTVGDTTYTTTIADAENTTSTITLAQFTVPANTWANGQEIVLDMHWNVLQNTGGTAQAVFTVGGTTITDLVSASLAITTTTTQAANFTRIKFVRLGSGVAFTGVIANNTVGYADGPVSPLFGQSQGQSWDSSVTFTSDITLYFKVALGSASANYYIRTMHARAFKRNAGTVK